METTTFTDCVNCLIAYTNNPHSLDVSLNAIAFLRFCAMKLAEGARAAGGVGGWGGGGPRSCERGAGGPSPSWVQAPHRRVAHFIFVCWCCHAS